MFTMRYRKQYVTALFMLLTLPAGAMSWSDHLRINKLIIDVKRSLFEGIGKPEPLKKTQLDSGHAKLKIPIDWFVTSMSR